MSFTDYIDRAYEATRMTREEERAYDKLHG